MDTQNDKADSYKRREGVCAKALHAAQMLGCFLSHFSVPQLIGVCDQC
jgi:hypothetical protein